MRNLAPTIIELLQDLWDDINPPSTPLAANVTFSEDEYEPNKLSTEVLVEDFPDEKEFITTGKYKVSQRVKITIYVRPKVYTKSELDACKVLFTNIKTKIDTIFGTDVSYRVSGWNDGNTVTRGRGLKSKPEPVIFRSTETLTKIYYI